GRPAPARGGGAARARLFRHLLGRTQQLMEELAQVYGRSLFQVAREHDKLEVIREQLGQVADALAERRELQTFFFSPYFSTEEKQMQINPDEITSILKSRIEGLGSGAAELTEVGTVLSVADGIARLHGLESCMSFEMLELPHGVTGLALNLESDNVGAVLFGEWERISEGDTVKRTGALLEIPVG